VPHAQRPGKQGAAHFRRPFAPVYSVRRGLAAWTPGQSALAVLALGAKRSNGEGGSDSAQLIFWRWVRRERFLRPGALGVGLPGLWRSSGERRVFSPSSTRAQGASAERFSKA